MSKRKQARVYSTIHAPMRAGKPPERRGSQHRRTCEPAGHSYPGKGWTKLDGPRVLTETPPGPYCRDLDAKPEAPPAK